MADRIQIRRDLAANWTSTDPVLAQGEMGFETDTLKLKFGDGSTAWTALAYYQTADPDYFDFTTGLADPSELEGRLYYDDTNKTIALYDDITGTSMQFGQEFILRCLNKSGVTITNGSVVYIDTAVSNKPTIQLADANLDTADQTIGLATHDILNNGEGKITLMGVVNGINTTAFTAGDTLYLSETAGEFTATPPAKPNHIVRIGVALNKTASGSILITVEHGEKLDELHDVDITSLTDLDLLQYDSASSTWINVASSTVGVTDHTGLSNIGTNTHAQIDTVVTKVAGIEAGATADQSDAEIKTAYENNADTNAFTDAEQTKLGGVEALADVTDETNVAATASVIANNAHRVDTGNPHSTTATHVGLGNVTNESKATMFTSPTFTGTFQADLASAATGYVLTATDIDGNATWQVSAAGFSDPLTTVGDIIYKDDPGNVTTRLPRGTDGQVLTSTTTGINWEALPASGDVVGPASATNNEVARFDGTTGKLIQSGSGVLFDDWRNITNVDDLSMDGTLTNTASGGFSATYTRGVQIGTPSGYAYGYAPGNMSIINMPTTYEADFQFAYGAGAGAGVRFYRQSKTATTMLLTAVDGPSRPSSILWEIEDTSNTFRIVRGGGENSYFKTTGGALGVSYYNLGDKPFAVNSEYLEFYCASNEYRYTSKASGTGVVRDVRTIYDQFHVGALDITGDLSLDGEVISDLNVATGNALNVYGVGAAGDADTEFLETTRVSSVWKIRSQSTGTGVERQIHFEGSGIRFTAAGTVVADFSAGDVRLYSGRTIRPLLDNDASVGKSAQRFTNVYSYSGDFSETVTAAAIRTAVQTVTAASDTLVNTTDSIVLCDASSNAITINLDAAVAGVEYTIKKIDSSVNAITIDGNGSETIDGALTATITTQYESVTLVSDGSNWFIT